MTFKSRRRAIVFTRYPDPGTTKTRLIPALGARGAAAVHRALVERAMRAARSMDDATIEVRYSGASAAMMADWLGSDLRYRPQPAGDLGARMSGCFDDALAEGATAVILFGTDLPGLQTWHLEAAFSALLARPLALGPATDGGYYLIGLTQRAPSLFSRMRWSTPEVLRQTLERAEGAALGYTLTAALDDLDRPEDLERVALAHVDRYLEPDLPWLRPLISAA